MRVFKAELFRIIKSGVFWASCCALLLGSLATGLLYEEHRFIDESGYKLFPTESYLHLKKDLNRNPEASEFLRESLNTLKESLLTGGKYTYTDNIFSEINLFEFVLAQTEQVEGYNEYLAGIVDSSKNLTQVSLFSKVDSFYHRNIIKTADVYARLAGTVPIWDESMGIKSITSSIYVNLLFLFSLLFLTLKIVTEEKPQELLLWTFEYGRGTRIMAKLGVLVLYCFFIHTMLFLSQFLFAHVYYGLGDLSRPIQSVFHTAPYGLSVLRTLFLLYAVKLTAYILFALIFFLICTKTRDAFTALGAVAAIFGFSALMYFFISPFSVLNIFKYVNLIYLINPAELIISYININLFGYPVNLTFIIAVLACITVPLLTAVPVFSAFKMPIYRRISLVPGYLDKMNTTVNIFTHEAWKLLWSQKVLFILMGFALLQVWRVDAFRVRVYPDEAQYRIAVEAAQLQPEPLKWALSRLEALELNHSNENEISAMRRVVERLQYLQDIPGGKLVYDTGYNELLGDAKHVNHTLNALLLIVALLLTVLPVREWEMGYVLRTTFYGRKKLFLNKMALAGLAGIVVFITVYLPDFMVVLRAFGLTHFDATAMSLPWLGNISTSLGLVLGRTYVIRLLTVFAVILMMISLPVKTRIGAVTLFTVVFVLPILLCLFKVPFVDGYPIVWLLTNTF